MPQLRFHAIDSAMIKQVSTAMTTELGTMLECDRENFVLEQVSSSYIWDGADSTGYPFIEVYCFDRGEKAFDQMADVITKHMLAAGCPGVDVAFILLERRRYYEDGKHF